MKRDDKNYWLLVWVVVALLVFWVCVGLVLAAVIEAVLS